MGVQVIIETITGNGYRATGAGGLSIGLTAEGATEAEAIDATRRTGSDTRERRSEVDGTERRRGRGPLEARCRIPARRAPVRALA